MLFSLLTLLVAFFILIALMIIHEFGHFIIAKKFGVKVEEFGIGYPPRIYGKQFGDTLYSINWIPLGAFVRIHGEEGAADEYRSFAGLAIWKRVLIVIGGVAAFWLASMIIFSVVFFIGADLPVGDQPVQGMTNPRVEIMAVQAGSPAAAAGLQTHDVIKSITVNNSVFPINTVKGFQDITAQQKGKPLIITVARAGKMVATQLTPRTEAPKGQGSVGVEIERMATLIQQYSWYQAPIKGIAYTWETTVNTVVGLYQTFKDLLVVHQLPSGAEFAGPLGITIFLANAASYGPGFFLYFIGVISVVVAIFNVFPIPALDGGKLVFLLIEKIKGKPVSPILEQRISIVFFVILICLSLFITLKFDIPRLIDFVKTSMQP